MLRQKTIYLANPRGFCAGVDRAIETVETALKIFNPPLYVKHEIVHNKNVVENLKSKGVIFVEDLEEIPCNNNVIFSAHGVSPKVWEIAEKRKLNVIDATCPLVTKVHLEAKRLAKSGFRIIFIGHKNHVETIGTFGEAPDKIIIIENEKDIDELPPIKESKIAYLTQTTLSVRETANLINKLKDKYTQIIGPKTSDICYATTNRQEAVSKIANKVDLLLVIGSKNSSNSNRLRELAESCGTKSKLIDNYFDIKNDWFSNEILSIGLTAGASAPENIILEVIQYLKETHGFSRIKEISVKDETLTFQLPLKLKNIQKEHSI
ncbi:MAG: 4-hydroxy-3-methylbut-2-enyl diphosphate reductase [Spirochaetia bacterium]|nr:4-hydroxy-3-methylbut-2-enyl diphosphate reductase [Spirochaetia bacterium]